MIETLANEGDGDEEVDLAWTGLLASYGNNSLKASNSARQTIEVIDDGQNCDFALRIGIVAVSVGGNNLAAIRTRRQRK